MGIGFLINIKPAFELRHRLKTLTVALKFGLAPHASILIRALIFFGVMLTLTGLVLFIMLRPLRPKSVG
jgi:hypothetical protein